MSRYLKKAAPSLTYSLHGMQTFGMNEDGSLSVEVKKKKEEDRIYYV